MIVMKMMLTNHMAPLLEAVLVANIEICDNRMSMFRYRYRVDWVYSCTKIFILKVLNSISAYP